MRGTTTIIGGSKVQIGPDLRHGCTLRLAIRAAMLPFPKKYKLKITRLEPEQVEFEFF